MQAGIQAVGDTYTRKALISPTKVAVGKDGKRHRYPSKARQCKLLGIARSTSYYKRKEGESQRNLKMMELMDEQHNKCAAMGVRQMVDYLKGKGYHVGKKLVRRLMTLMGGGEGCISAQKPKQGSLDQVSYAISASWFADNETQSGMEHRHHLHTYGERIHVSVCHH